MDMKTKLITFSLLLATVILIGACSSSNSVMPVPVNSTYMAILNGASETPSNSSTGTGTATFTYNPNTNIITNFI